MKPTWLLQTIGHYLGAMPTLRLEWSLEYARDACHPRGAPLFWLGSEGSLDNPRAFKALESLLRELGFPDIILAVHQQLSPSCHYQGFAYAFREGAPHYRLFFHYRDEATGEERRKCLRWSPSEISVIDYGFELFSERGALERLRQWVHPHYAPLLEGLLEAPGLLRRSGYWNQIVDGVVSEVYLTYPRHPLLGQVVSGDSHDYAGLLQGLSPYRHLPFRHLGISSAYVEEPTFTVYFSAPHEGSWPCSQDELYQKVALASRKLHQRLQDTGERV